LAYQAWLENCLRSLHSEGVEKAVLKSHLLAVAT
jgi:hypothetical protein